MPRSRLTGDCSWKRRGACIQKSAPLRPRSSTRADCCLDRISTGRRLPRSPGSTVLVLDICLWRTKEIRTKADQIRLLVEKILSSGSVWSDRENVVRTIGLDDILIIAPYNAQVFELQQRIPGGRLGTVDKFQGQEAPIVIYSITTSSHADAPRGMEFLYSANRLNVATSRAKCVCILVGSPNVFEAECRTPRQMQLANAFCRYLEMATII
jgi:AAA domain